MSIKPPPRPLKYAIATAPPPTKFSLTSPRGAKLATRVWWNSHKATPKALCLVVHGGGWHSGYFEGLAAGLNKQDIFVASYDQIGCGYSEPDPDSPAPDVTHVRTFDWFVEDVFAALEWMELEAKDATSQKDLDVPVFLFGESFGALEVLGAALSREEYGNPRLDGVISSGGLLKMNDIFLPPRPVVLFLIWLAKYYPRLLMPATDFDSTFDDAFGDKEWARTCRQDEKISTQIRPTIGGIAATLSTGEKIRAQALDFPIPLYAIHGKRDIRTSCEAMQEFIDKLGPEKGEMDVIDTDGHQLLQDDEEIVQDVIQKVADWINRQTEKD